MAKRTVIVDDLTGDEGARTRVLRFDGVDYEIDLTDASFADLRTLLKPYLRAARSSRPGTGPSSVSRPGRTASKPSTASKPRPDSDSAAIRAWARGTGVAVTERGRVPASVREAWVAAGSPR